MAATCSTEGAVEVAVWLGAAVPRAISKPPKNRVTIRLVMGSSSLNRDFLFGSENVEHCTPALFSRRALESSHLLEDSKAVIRVGRWRPVGRGCSASRSFASRQWSVYPCSGVDTTDAVAADVSDEFGRWSALTLSEGNRHSIVTNRGHATRRSSGDVPFQKQLDIRRQRYYLRCASAAFVSRKICFTEFGQAPEVFSTFDRTNVRP